MSGSLEAATYDAIAVELHRQVTAPRRKAHGFVTNGVIMRRRS